MASLSRGKLYSLVISLGVALGVAAQIIAMPVEAQEEPAAAATEAESAAGEATAAEPSDVDEFDFDDLDEDLDDEVADEDEETAEDPVEADEYKNAEIMTVTANKREENIQEVPVSVTALGADFVEETGLTDFEGIQKFVPNLAILGGTDTRSTSIRIRGIGSVGTNAGIDPSVGLFIDGVYQGRAGMSMSDLMDIQGIEVLRGPQGTLYGKNTAAGLISINTADPSYDFSSLVEGTLGNYNFMQARAMVNVPIIDERWATRTSFYRTVREGWDENLYDGSRVNDLEKWGIRHKWLVDFTDELSVVFAGDYANQTSDCCVPDIITYEGDSLLWGGPNPQDPPVGFPDRNVNPNFEKMSGFTNPVTPDQTTPGDTYDRFHGNEVTTPKPELRNFELYDGIVDVDLAPRNDVTIWGVQADADYVMGDWSVNWLSAYRAYLSDSQFDGDFSQYNAVAADTTEDLEQVSTELRLTSPMWDHFDFVSGFYFFYMNHYTNGNIGYEQDFADIFIRTQNRDGERGYWPINNNDINRYKTYSYALYGQGNARFLDHWVLTGGLRLSLEKKTVHRRQFSDSNLNAPPISGDDIDEKDERRAEDISGTVKLVYQRDDWMVYGSFATGFKSGGFNQLRTAQDVDPEFDDERAFAYEAGYRSTWLDQDLVFNLTGYLTDYDDFQAQSFDGTSITIRNAGSFYSYGFESEIIWLPIDDLSWRSGIGFNMTRYQDFDEAENTVPNIVERAASWTGIPARPALPGEPGLAPFTFTQRIGVDPAAITYIDDTTAQDLSGKRLDNAPRWSINSSLNYERQIGTTPVKWIAHADYTFRSAIYLNQDLDPVLKQDPLHLLDLRAGIAEETNQWELIFWVRNTLGSEYLVSGFDIPVLGGYAGIHGDPRTWGGTVRWRY